MSSAPIFSTMSATRGVSFSEYSAGIDFVPADCDWKSGDHAPEDSFYVWGPNPPDYFTHNAEA